MRLGMLFFLGMVAALVASGCRTSSGSKLRADDLSGADGPRIRAGVWLVESEQMVHIGTCPKSEVAELKNCRGLREPLVPISLSEYELRLRQAVVNYRVPGTPIVMAEATVLDTQPTIRLAAVEEARVSEVIRSLRDNPGGLFDDADAAYRLALAPFVPMGGSVDSMWLTKSRALPGKSTRQNFGAVTPSYTYNFDGIAAEKPVLLADGTVVISTGASILWVKNGVKRFEFRTREVSGSSPALFPDGTVVVGKGNKVYWLKNGVKLAEFQSDALIESSPSILSDGTVVVGSEGGVVYWLRSGEKLAEFKTGGAVRSSAAVIHDDVVVVGSADGKVYWLKDGDKRFEFATGDAVMASPVAMIDGTIVVGSLDNKVYWLKDGAKRFEFTTGGDVRVSPVLLSDGTVVAASEDYMLYWLKDGAKVFDFQGQVRSSPAVLSDDTVVVGIGIGIYWIKNGLKRFEFRKDGEAYGSPVVLDDGTVVVGADNNRKFDNGRIFWLE